MTAQPSPTEQPDLARRQNWTNQLARHALMQPDATAMRFLGRTTTWKVTAIFLVPAQWQAVCAAQRALPRGLKLRVLSWGAEPASDSLLRDMSETSPGTQIFAAFGQTEMSAVTCMLLAQDAMRKLGSVGKVIPTVAARVVDEDMNDVPVGLVGEIVYRAPTLMDRLLEQPTGDRGRVRRRLVPLR